jgi:hypothetical protein
LSKESVGIIAAIVPDTPGTPTYLLSTKTQIAFKWTAPLSNGGSAITGYKIDWAS